MLPCSNSNFPAMKSAVALSSALPLSSRAGSASVSTLPSLDDLGDEIAFVGEAVGGSEGRKVGDAGCAGGGGGRHAAGLDVIDRGLGNGVGIVANLVFVMVAVFTDVIDQDGAAILQADGVRAGARNGDRKQSSDSNDSDT